MEEKILFEIGDIQEALTRSIGIVDVVADGLSCYLEHSALSGPRAQAYLDAVTTASDALSEVNKRLQAVLNSAHSSGRERTAA